MAGRPKATSEGDASTSKSFTFRLTDVERAYLARVLEWENMERVRAGLPRLQKADIFRGLLLKRAREIARTTRPAALPPPPPPPPRPKQKPDEELTGEDLDELLGVE